MFDDDDIGCIGGILRLMFLSWLFDWLQDNFGFGAGPCGWGCGVVFMVIFFIMACGVLCGTNWFQLF